jgi:hypothetical protein
MTRQNIAAMLAASAMLLVTPVHAEPQKYAVLVGVNDQEQPSDPYSEITVLKGPGNDVELMQKLLVDRFGFMADSSHMTTLVGKQATVTAIRKALTTDLLPKLQAHPGSTVIFYYSGHGSQADDIDHDEGDNLDETLVAYDSRSDSGSDILDDDIETWLAELQLSAGHIAVILDSCHSDTGTRNVNVVARRVPPNKNNLKSATAPVPSSPVTARDIFMPRTPRITLIAGSRADELSYEGVLETPMGKRPQGYMTASLYNILSQNPGLTYREAKDLIEGAVVRMSAGQHPQTEGDLNQIVFGGATHPNAVALRVVNASNDGSLNVGGGKLNGLYPGTFLSIYQPNTMKLSGHAGKIADARVEYSSLTTASASIIGTPVTIPQNAKVAVVTPNFGFDPIRLKIDQLPDQLTSAADASFLAKVSTALAGNSLVATIRSDQGWDLAVQRGCLINGKRIGPVTGASPGGCTPIYYFATPEQSSPLFGFHVLASESQAARHLADASIMHARQRAFRLLHNRSSELSGLLKISLVRVKTVLGPGGTVSVVGHEVIPDDGMQSLKVGDYYAMKIENRSSKDLFASLIVLGTSGAVIVQTPAPKGDLVRSYSFFISKPMMRAGGPPGIETYKVIASTSDSVDYTLLESPGTTKSVSTAPLAWLLAQTATASTKDPGSITNLTVDEWVTSQIDLQIME